ncbi:mannitol dehydrogenase family protein [Acidimangrovimonas sediminis]|uniref:mannitol dehydrogenase family protein n=1 Tax=Acidimangrovimonas sediminis TaxID=2056283 RepID=UPI000C808CAF|nr:mannitol dehydrogenase family protein [Acidimangrovimonas sediminis]
MRLSSATDLPAELRPGYDPQAHGTGIVHLGLGAFARAHLAAATDAALAQAGGDWRILGVSLRSSAPAEELTPQDGLYTLIERDGTGAKARVIGALSGAICSAGDPGPALAAMADAGCRIVTLTVTEKAYGLNRATRGCDPDHPAVAADLAAPDRPQGVLGLIVRALEMRRAGGLAPFTVLCCDNLPENGPLLRGAVIDFARRIYPGLADWIAAETSFPATMVDRITPAPTDATRAEAARLTGAEDLAAVETEPFLQWVIEDSFPLGRPAWEAGGALFVPEVTPYEEMKLRMLNGSHSLLAYAGFHAGHRYVRDVMADPALAALVRRHLSAAAATLAELPGIDLGAYSDALAARFGNPAIAHETFQIAMDGSEKMPQRIFAALPEARSRGVATRSFAFATAAWLRHASGATHDCPPYELRDPRAAELTAAFRGRDAAEIVAAVASMGIAPPGVFADEGFREETQALLADMLARSMTDVIADEARVAAACA